MHWLTCQTSALKIPPHKPYIFLMVMINCIDLHIRQVQFTLRWPLRPVGLLLNFVNIFSLFCNYLPLEKGGALHLNKFESPSSKDALCQVWLKFKSINTYDYIITLIKRRNKRPTGLNGHLSVNYTCQTCKSMHLIMTIKNIFGLWVGISTIFKIISKLYNKGGSNDP